MPKKREGVTSAGAQFIIYAPCWEYCISRLIGSAPRSLEDATERRSLRTALGTWALRSHGSSRTDRFASDTKEQVPLWRGVGTPLAMHTWLYNMNISFIVNIDGRHRLACHHQRFKGRMHVEHHAAPTFVRPLPILNGHGSPVKIDLQQPRVPGLNSFLRPWLIGPWLWKGWQPRRSPEGDPLKL